MCEKRFQRDYSELDRIFGFIEAFGASHDIGSSFTFPVQLAVEELFTNMVKHNDAGAGEISIRLERSDDGVRVTLTDADADEFDPTAHPVPRLEGTLEERAVGGLGLHLVRSLVDDLRHEYAGRRNTVTIIKNVAT